MFGAYELDLSAKIVLLNDYLKGLSFLHQKGIMHRDINPNNLAITSFDEPKGLIIDLDAATPHELSRDHMKGTLAYLAPEVIDLKDNKPSNYDKSVDIWALGLSMFAICTGHLLRWTYVDPDGTKVSQVVNPKSHKRHLMKINQAIESAQDADTKAFLRLIIQMTAYKPKFRPTASSASDTSATLRKDRKGRIVLKATQKRRLEE